MILRLDHGFTPLLFSLGLVFVAVTGGAGCDSSGNGGDAGTPRDIVATAQAAGGFNTLVAAVSAADLTATLKSPGPFTVFAPTDAAFAKLPAGTVDELLRPENKAMLQAVLTYHVLPGEVRSAQVATLTSATTVQGGTITITVSGSTVEVNEAVVTAVDIDASNGVIHVIDTVLLPPASSVRAPRRAGNRRRPSVER